MVKMIICRMVYLYFVTYHLCFALHNHTVTQIWWHFTVANANNLSRDLKVSCSVNWLRFLVKVSVHFKRTLHACSTVCLERLHVIDSEWHRPYTDILAISCFFVVSEKHYLFRLKPTCYCKWPISWIRSSFNHSLFPDILLYDLY